MTSSLDSLLKTEKYPHKKLTLDSSNYSQWATGFKMWAGGLGLWPYISGDEKEPSPPTKLSDPDQNILWKEKHDEHDFVYLCDMEDLNVGWEALAGKYLPQKAIRNSIAEMLQSLVVLRSDLTALSISPPTAAAVIAAGAPATPAPSEYKVPDAIFVHILLCTLPDYYDPFRQTRINSSTSLDFNDIALQMVPLKETVSPPRVSMSQREMGGYLDGVQSADTVPKLGTFGCNVVPRLSKDKKNSKSATPLSSPAAIATNLEVSTADHPDDANTISRPPFILTLKEHSTNISSSLAVPMGSFHVDSASTAHMEPDISCFAHYTKLHEPIHVKLADNCC
ncbi:hypothetical protein DFH29DRAFT_1000967 [Suillus ampliporus]|nr:hypothetical protein DFH29DRAFT_1000967 [Suillus ampliporus]